MASGAFIPAPQSADGLDDLRQMVADLPKKVDSLSLAQDNMEQRILEHICTSMVESTKFCRKIDDKVDHLETHHAIATDSLRNDVRLMETTPNKMLDGRCNYLLDRVQRADAAINAIHNKFGYIIASRLDPPSLRALAIPELLEQVLLNLPVKDILLAQRVNRGFKATIDGSKKLQQALFFSPEPASVSPTLNPLLSSKCSLRKIALDLRNSGFPFNIVQYEASTRTGYSTRTTASQLRASSANGQTKLYGSTLALPTMNPAKARS